MAEQRGCGVLFFDKKRRRVLLVLRDEKPGIPFPGQLDTLGGSVEENETPEQAIIREIAEELHDLRSKAPMRLQNFTLFEVYEDECRIEQHVFCQEIDFDVSDVRLEEGSRLEWISEGDLEEKELAFRRNEVVKRFFESPFMR